MAYQIVAIGNIKLFFPFFPPPAPTLRIHTQYIVLSESYSLSVQSQIKN